jgi:UDP-GlcNAc:undecaprenyl-phosphate GlcNAc-1-phosphate transferase
MTLEPQLLIGLLTGTAIAYAATPVAMRAAVRLHFLDRPAGYKGHATPTPYLGGAAVVLAFVCAVMLAAGHPERTGPVVVGAVLLWAVGTTDDRVNLSPYLRLGIEFAIAAGLWAVGLGWELGFGGAVDLAVTALWIAGVVNAFNLFDNMDGAAGTMACVVAGAVAILGVVLGDAWLAVCGGALCGACLGFLPYNLCSPPRIFLGDGGSMPVGFIVAALVMIGASDAVRYWQALAMALLLVGIPLLDTCLVVISRRRRGLSVLTGGRDHLTHRTRRRLRTVRAVAVALGTAQALLAVLALAAYRGGSLVLVIVVAAYVLAAALAIEVLDADFADDAQAAGVEMRQPAAPRRPAILAGLLGLTFGLSPFYDGGYDSSVWGPAGLVLLACLLALAIGRPPVLSRPAKLALAALAALAGWSLLSVLWTSSPELGFVASNRMIVLVAMLAVLLLVVTDTASATWAVAGAIAGTLVVGLWTVGVMVAGDGVQLFAFGRLNDPLGYVNAQGAVYAFAVIPLLSLAEWRASPRVAAIGAACGSMCLGLAFLSQSRGVIAALVVGMIVTFALFAGRLRRAAALLVMAAPVAIASPWLLHAYEQGKNHAQTPDSIRKVALLVVFAAITAGVGWWLAANTVTSMGPARRRRARRAWAVALGVATAAVVVVGLVEAPQIQQRAQVQYHAFVDLGSDPATEQVSRSRLLTGSGGRYDYWRIAVKTWREHPVAGLGAGGYSLPYFQQRRTSEAVRQPHSIELEMLSELGLVGGLLLAVWIAAVVWAIVRGLRGRVDEPRRHLLVAATGLFVVWITQTSGDWLHLIPGVTGVAMVAVAVLARFDAAPAAASAPAARGMQRSILARRAVIGVAGACVLLGLLSLSRQTLAEHYRTRAQEDLARSQPAAALDLADRSIRIDGDAVSAYYLRSAALAQLDRVPEARAALSRALDVEPENFVTWALIGDFESRTGRPRRALAAYRRASALNPRDTSLSDLAVPAD